eukprot:1752732-Prorocentrum_lima.AAC.1
MATDIPTLFLSQCGLQRKSSLIVMETIGIPFQVSGKRCTKGQWFRANGAPAITNQTHYVALPILRNN